MEFVEEAVLDYLEALTEVKRSDLVDLTVFTFLEGGIGVDSIYYFLTMLPPCEAETVVVPTKIVHNICYNSIRIGAKVDLATEILQYSNTKVGPRIVPVSETLYMDMEELRNIVDLAGVKPQDLDGLIFIDRPKVPDLIQEMTNIIVTLRAEKPDLLGREGTWGFLTEDILFIEFTEEYIDFEE